MLNQLLLALLASILTNNLVLSRGLGLYSFEAVSQKGRVFPIVKTALYLTIILVISTLIYYPLYYFLLIDAQMTYLSTLYVGIIVLLVSTLVLRFAPNVFKGKLVLQQDELVYVLISSLIVGFLLQSTSVPVNYLQAIVKSIGSGLGFGVVGVLFTTIRYRLEIAPIPQSFKGLPIALITAGLLAMAFLGFSGLV